MSSTSPADEMLRELGIKVAAQDAEIRFLRAVAQHAIFSTCLRDDDPIDTYGKIRNALLATLRDQQTAESAAPGPEDLARAVRQKATAIAEQVLDDLYRHLKQEVRRSRPE